MEIIIPPLVKKKLAKINPKDVPKAQKKIELLLTNPLAGKPLEGEYKSYRSLKAWPLRIVYFFEPQNQTIHIANIDYRGRVYK